MDTNNITVALHEWILQTCNKEGIAIFVVSCIGFFLLASCLAYWAWKTGEFTNIEEAKFEMMDGEAALIGV